MSSERHSESLILGDWGTSRLRLHLCHIDAAGLPVIRATAEGQGVRLTGGFEAAFVETLRKLPPNRSRDVLLAGMAGSNLGWREAPYVACPAAWADLMHGALTFSATDRRITIMPGASCRNRSGLFDVMRGEETQLLGLSRLRPDGRSRRLVCLPGTHTKWAIIDADGLQTFTTSIQGELFDLLRTGSVLVPRNAAGTSLSGHVDRAAFRYGVELLRRNEGLPLTEALFSVRSRCIAGELAAEDAESCLSGLLIGADVRDTGKPMLESVGTQSVLLVGEDALTELFAAAMAQHGIDTVRYPGESCVVRGLAACQETLREQPHGA